MGTCTHSLFEVLRTHGKASARSAKSTSNATETKRREVLEMAFRQLRKHGYRLPDVRSFRTKHIQFLVKLWQSKGIALVTIANRLSVLRVFAGWIGKHGLVRGIEHYIDLGGQVIRPASATQSKAWSDKGIDPLEKIAEVAARSAIIGMMLELQLVFGLRSQESWLFRPILADKGPYITVNWGAKNGRRRVVPVDSDLKRKVLDKAKTMVEYDNASLIPSSYQVEGWKTHYYAILKECGISRKDGITAHGLRHEYANDRFYEILGYNTPVRGGAGEAIDQEKDYAARTDIGEELGHSREDVTGLYYGTRPNKSRRKLKVDRRK